VPTLASFDRTSEPPHKSQRKIIVKRLLRVFFFYILAHFCVASADELVSFELVRQSSGSAEVRQTYAVSASVRMGDRLELFSDSGPDFGLMVMRSVYSELGNRVITATTDAGGTAVLVVGQDGKLFGSITEMGERHQIFTAADGERKIVKEGYSGYEKRIDNGGVSPRLEIPIPNIELELDELEVRSSPYRMMRAERSLNVIYPLYKAGTAKIAVLMYYDESMPNAASIVDFITQVANDAFADSGARIEIEIVGTKALNIEDDASHYDLKSAMIRAEAPFDVIESDRALFSADLVFLLRDTASPDGEDPCGIASIGVYKQRHWRAAYTGLVQWDPVDGFGSYCTDYTFAHEVGHNLGAQHNRGDLTDEGENRHGAYSYSHGYKVGGTFRTVMGVNGNSPAQRVGLFSFPELNCEGYPCGIPKSQSDSADNVSTLHSTGHLVASNEGTFAFEAVSAFAVREGASECTTTDGEAGYWTGAGIHNQSSFSVELVSHHFRRADGSLKVYEYDAGERVAQSGSSTSGGFCRAEGESPVFGTAFTEVFMRYKHPETGAIVETETHEAVDNYDGEYRKVRVASGGGGLVSGNPAQVVRVGSSQTFTFMPDVGYDVASIRSNCSGRQSGNNYTVDVGLDDCFIEATFNQVVALQQTDNEACNAYGMSGAYIQKIFIAYLGRAPAPEGLAYWAEFLDEDQELGKLTLFDNLYYSAEAEALYQNAMVGDRVEQFFQFMYGRAPQVTGKNFWVDAINNGDVTVPESAAVIADSGGGPDLAVLNAKQVAATKLTCAIGDDEPQLNAYQQNISAARASIAAIATAEQAESYDGVAELARIIEAGP
jgi:hypothetical protein